jgi:hypothetical protein
MGFVIEPVVSMESIDLYNIQLKSFFAPRRIDYVSPVTEEHEERTQAVLFGIRKVFSEYRAKQISEKEKKTLIQKLKEKIEIMQTMLDLLLSNQSLADFKERKWEAESFDYCKIRKMEDFYRISHLLGASACCLLLSQLRDKRLANIEQKLDREYTQKELDMTLWHLRNSMEDGYSSFLRDYAVKLNSDGIDVFEVSE